jgi:hypothetical protein
MAMKAKVGFSSKILKKLKGLFTGNTSLTQEQEAWLVANGWVTLDSGTHVQFGEGEIVKGPKALKGKSFDKKDSKKLSDKDKLDKLRKDLDDAHEDSKKEITEAKGKGGSSLSDRITKFFESFRGSDAPTLKGVGRALRLKAAKMGRKVGQISRSASKLLDKLTGNEEGEVPDEVFADFILNAEDGFDSDEQRMAFFGRLKGGKDSGGKGAKGKAGKAAKKEASKKGPPTVEDYLKLQNDARAREESQGKTALQKAQKRMTGKDVADTAAATADAAKEVLKAKEDAEAEKQANAPKVTAKSSELDVRKAVSAAKTRDDLKTVLTDTESAKGADYVRSVAMDHGISLAKFPGSRRGLDRATPLELINRILDKKFPK